MSKVADVFNIAASVYDDWYNQPKGNKVFEAESKLMNHLLPKEGLGLEIGAGTGIFAEKFSDKKKIIKLTPELVNNILSGYNREDKNKKPISLH